MIYQEWTLELGKHRWRTKDGLARTYYPLPGNYDAIYDVVCGFADVRFATRTIPEPYDLFYTDFISMVPKAWNLWKTQMELFIGTLDGLNIDPNIFEAGFTRYRSLAGNRDDREIANEQTTQGYYTGDGKTLDQTIHEDNATATTKSRALLYHQGAQAQPNIDQAGIGELGNDYLSSIQDTIGNSDTQGSNSYNESQSDPRVSAAAGSSTGIKSRTAGQEFGELEKIHETRINYYDNLAFLRERADHIKGYKDFSEYFMPLFALVESCKLPWTGERWNYIW